MRRAIGKAKALDRAGKKIGTLEEIYLVEETASRRGRWARRFEDRRLPRVI